MKIIKTGFKVLGSFLALAVILMLILILMVTLADFKPPLREILKPAGKVTTDAIQKKTFSVLLWNIGYAGLGSEMDFFYDGGKKVRPKQDYYNICMDGIKKFIQQNDTVDFIFLQEVDKKSHRSFRENQVEQLQKMLPAYESVFAANYDVMFVPIPLNRPMGKVLSGVVSLSRYNAHSSERVSFEGNFKWPKNLFMLDRCFIIQRFVLSSGKVLVMINTHNSAFDDGSLRMAELNVLKQTATEEFRKGNYVVIGGDWNLNPPGYKLSMITTGDIGVGNDVSDTSGHLMPEGWQWAFDNTTPSNRFADEPYQKGRTKTTILDYFLLSPNIQIENIETVDFGFRYSDHNPVKMNFKLK